LIILGLDLLIEACEQRAQHPAVVVQPPGAEVLPPVHPVRNKNKHKKCVVDHCPSPSNVSYHLFPKCEILKSEWKKICSKTFI
jgi:hypothetical protein